MATNISFGFCSVSTACLVLFKCSAARLWSLSSALNRQICTDLWHGSYFNRVHPSNPYRETRLLRHISSYMHSVQIQIAASRDGDADLKQARDCAPGHLYNIWSLYSFCLNKSLENQVLFTFSERGRTTIKGFKIPSVCRNGGSWMAVPCSHS